MSDENVTATGTAPARKMVSVNGKNLGPKENKGDLVFIKPNKMTADQVNTVIAAGIYEKRQLYTFDNGDTRNDFIIRNEAGNAVSLAPNKTLETQLGKVATGSYVEVTYLGSEVMTKGPGKGKTTHKFVIGIAADDMAAGE